MASLLHVRVGCFVSEVFFAIYILDSIVLSLMKLKGLSQPLPCFCLHLEWFLSRENNGWLGWKWIAQKICTFDGRENGGWSIWVR